MCDSNTWRCVRQHFQTEVHRQKHGSIVVVVVVVFAYQPALVLDPELCCEADVSSWRLVGEAGGSESPAWGVPCSRELAEPPGKPDASRVCFPGF